MKLHQELLELRKQEKALTTKIIEKLQQMEASHKYLSLGYSSLFDYLVRGLGYSESAAYQKQSCLRLTKEMPEIKTKMDSGALTASGLSMAFKHLKKKSTTQKRELLKKLEHQPTREIKKILQQEEVAPEIKIKKTEYSDKVILRLELTKAQNKKLEKLKALKSHGGDTSQLLESLIDQALKKYQPRTNARLRMRGKSQRYIPWVLKNQALDKAHYQCQYPGCKQTHYLQVDHIVPVRAGGRAEPDNLQILCGAHNRHKG